MKKFSDVRKIKIIGDIVDENAFFIVPNTLQMGKNLSENQIYPTQFFIDNSHLYTHINKNDKQLVKGTRTKSEYMEIPDLSIPLTDVLNLYNVNTYDDLFTLLKQLIDDNKSEYTIFRLVNTYTRVFYDDLIKKNNSLIKIFRLIFANNKITDEKINQFLQKWFEKNNKDDFNLNICESFKYFLSNKYESIR
jgi:hypothetical protein